MSSQRKVYIGVVITSIIMVVGWLITSETISGISPCSNEITKELASPNAKFNAVVFERSCGATTGYSTQVSVLKENEYLENESGNILIAEGHPKITSIELAWASPNVLLVKVAENSRYFKKSKRIGSIEVRYVP